jgi:hypothetical protein
MGDNHARRRSLARHWHFTGDGPDEDRHVSGNRHDHLVGRCPPCHKVSDTLAQARLSFPSEVLDGLGERLQAPLEMPADLGWIPLGPSPLDEGPASARVAGCGAAALAAAFATGVLRRGESQIAHERSGVLDTGQVAEFCDAGDGDDDLDATKPLLAIYIQEYTIGGYYV